MLKSILKLIIMCLVVLMILLGIYGLLIYLDYANGDIKYVGYTSFIFMIICFFMIALLFGNMRQKKGLLIGVITFIILFSIIILINGFTLNLKLPIYLLSSISGSKIGCSIKKFI